VLQAGALQVCITPPIGVELAGYGPRLGRYSRDLHDDLTAQALVLDDGHSRYALITCDLIALSPALVQQVRQEVGRRTRIPGEHVMIAATHSHTAPTAQSFNDWGAADLAYVRSIGRILAGAVAAAETRLQPARLSVTSTEHDALAWNRTGSDLLDTTVEVVQLTGEDDQPLALLVHYACHPVMLGPKPVISADYPGALRRALAAQYPGAVVLFANGACGDIDPLSNKAVWGQGTFDDVDRAGAALAAAVVRALAAPTPAGTPRIDLRRRTAEFAYNLPTLAAIQERIGHFSAEARALGNQPEDFKAPSGEVQMPRFWLRYYRMLERQLSAGTLRPTVEAELQAFSIGDVLTLVAIPAEVFTEQGLAIRQLSPFRHTLAVCYANGEYGYLPPRAEYEKGGYTAVLAAAAYGAPPYQPDVADRLVSAVDALLR
jgi:hypothetical protein